MINSVQYRRGDPNVTWRSRCYESRVVLSLYSRRCSQPDRRSREEDVAAGRRVSPVDGDASGGLEGVKRLHAQRLAASCRHQPGRVLYLSVSMSAIVSGNFRTTTSADAGLAWTPAGAGLRSRIRYRSSKSKSKLPVAAAHRHPNIAKPRFNATSSSSRAICAWRLRRNSKSNFIPGHGVVHGGR